MTEAQRKLLLELQKGPRYVADYYRPAQILVELGYAEWQGTKLKITEAGQNKIRLL